MEELWEELSFELEFIIPPVRHLPRCPSALHPLISRLSQQARYTSLTRCWDVGTQTASIPLPSFHNHNGPGYEGTRPLEAGCRHPLSPRLAARTRRPKPGRLRGQGLSDPCEVRANRGGGCSHGARRNDSRPAERGSRSAPHRWRSASVVIRHVAGASARTPPCGTAAACRGGRGNGIHPGVALCRRMPPESVHRHPWPSNREGRRCARPSGERRICTMVS
jgi:hypothetical protein